MDQTKRYSKRQHGGALLVSIIMIFMMSILGVSAMRGSTIERKMAGNSVVTNQNFQIAESLTEVSLNDMNNLTTAIIQDGTTVEVSSNTFYGGNVTSTGNLTFVGIGIELGSSIGDGNPGTFSSARFVAQGDSVSASVRANSEVHQGASRTIPAVN